MNFYLYKKLDWGLIFGIFILVICGLLSLASISPDNLFWRQLIWCGIFFAFLFLGVMFDWHWLVNQSWFRHGFYWLGVFLLIVLLIFGEPIRGAKSWFVIGFFHFGPSELMKVAVVLMLASFFARRYIVAWVGRNILISSLYVFIPTVLIAAQPDFGSAIIFIVLWLSFLFMAGVDKKKLIIGIVIVIIGLVFIWNFYLQTYQKERLIGFLFPNFDPLGVNYNVIQSKTAIGSAGFWGKGFGVGSQTKLGFLPEAHNDFIFAAFVEEWGIFGGVVVILTFLFVVYRISIIGIQAKNNYSKFIVLGTIFILIIHFILNVGANLGLLPVTGISFPFMSYGGSNLLTFAILMSIIQRIKLESL